jgi:hypothetical protein
VDHFLWLTNDRGACAWPGDSEPDMANVMKVVHFGWANSPTSPMAHHFGIANKVREQQQQQQQGGVNCYCCSFKCPDTSSKSGESMTC